MLKWLAEHVQYLALAGSLLSVLGAFVGSIKSDRDRAKFENEMRTKSDNMLTRATEAINNITGGDSMPTLRLSSPDPAGKVYADISNEGKYPCYDVFLRIENNTARGEWFRNELKAGRVHGASFDEDQFTTVYPLGNMPIGLTSSMFSLNIPRVSDTLDLTATLSARNGSIYARYSYRLKDGQWLVRYTKRLIRDGKSTDMGGHTDPGFPEDPPHAK